jgi:hypothetical protein
MFVTTPEPTIECNQRMCSGCSATPMLLALTMQPTRGLQSQPLAARPPHSSCREGLVGTCRCTPYNGCLKAPMSCLVH